MGGCWLEEAGPPPVVKEVHSKYWWCALSLMAGLFVCECIAADIFNAITTVILGLIIFFMVRQNCSQMSKYCLIMFGIVCIIQAIFQLIDLGTSVGGRTSKSSTETKADNQVTITIT